MFRLAIYDNTYATKSAVERPIYIEYQPTYNTGGAFSITAQKTENNSTTIEKGDYIWIEDNIIGIIDQVQISENSETIILKGTLGDDLLSRRCLFESVEFTDATISTIITSIFSRLTTIPNLTLEIYTRTTETKNTVINPGNFLEILQSLCQQFDVGYRIVRASSETGLQMKLQIFEGQDISETVVLSRKYESLTNFEFTDTAKEEVTFVKVLGQNSISVDVTTENYRNNLREYILDCTGIEQGELTDAEYEQILTTEGQKIIDAHKGQKTYTGDYTGLTFIFGQDYNLGDTVTLSGVGEKTEQKISGFLKQIDKSGEYTKLVFGEYQKSITTEVHTVVRKVEKLSQKTSSTTPSPTPSQKETFWISVNEPAAIINGDFLVTVENNTTVTNLQRKINDIWTDVEFEYGTSPQYASEDVYYCYIAQGAVRVIIYNNTLMAIAYNDTSYEPRPTNRFFINQFPQKYALPGDYWRKISDSTNKYEQQLYQLEGTQNTRWALKTQVSNGTGKFLNQNRTSVAHNDTTNNTTQGDYDYLIGYNNEITGTTNYTNNSPTSNYANFAGGRNNKAKNSTGAVLFGANNDFKTGNTPGNGHDGGIYDSISVGRNNKGLINDSVILGQHNDINAANCVIAGTYNVTRSDPTRSDAQTNINSAGVFGDYHTLSLSHQAVFCGQAADGDARSPSDDECFYFLLGHGSQNTPQNNFAIDRSGNSWAAGAYNTTNGDYAETYEWLDKNPNNEDRRGLFVTLEGKYIRPADSHDDYILGVISSNPSVCGDTYDSFWKGKYKRDVFGRILRDENNKAILSEDYAPQKYIPQSLRKEKSKVGTHGKLVVVDDGTCVVDEYCKPGLNGIATHTKNSGCYRVIERLDESHIKIVIK